MHFLWIAQFILMIIGPILFSAFRLLGIGFVSYVGFSVLMDQVLAYITSQLGSMSFILQNIMGLAKLDIVINIYFSAVTTSLIISGLNKAADRKRNQVWNPPGQKGGSIDA